MNTDERRRLVDLLITYQTLYRFWQSYSNGELGALFNDAEMIQVRSIIVAKMRLIQDELLASYSISLP